MGFHSDELRSGLSKQKENATKPRRLMKDTREKLLLASPDLRRCVLSSHLS